MNPILIHRCKLRYLSHSFKARNDGMKEYEKREGISNLVPGILLLTSLVNTCICIDFFGYDADSNESNFDP